MTVTRIELPAQRRVGHLTLIREPRNIDPEEFNALTAEERLHIVGRAAGRKKYELLLEAVDAEDLVPKLPAQELYALVRELGLEDTTELTSLLSAEQWATCLDLDCWDGDLLDGSRSLPWLRALLGAGEDRVLEILRQLDYPLLVLVLKRHTQVVAGPETIDDEDERMEARRRDGGYRFEFPDVENGKLVAALLDILFRGDNELFFGVVEGIRWEQTALLEEEVYQQRSVRLEEQGLPDPVEARIIYTWLDPDQLSAPDGGKVGRAAPDSPVPGFMLAGKGPADLLGEVLATGLDHETVWELAYLVNKVMMADGVDVGEIEEVQAATASVYRYLNLALESLAGNDAERAGDLLRKHYLEHLFRAGFSLTLRLSRRARAVSRSPVAAYLEGPFRSLLEGLLQTKPVLFEGVDRPERTGERPFATGRDLDVAARWLDKIEIQQRLFEGPLAHLLPDPAIPELVDCMPSRIEDLTLSELFLTALAHRLFGEDFLFRPLPQGRLADLQRMVCSGRAVRKAVRDQSRAWLEGLVEGGGAFGDFCLDLWEEEFCPLPEEGLDPRYFAGLVVRMEEC